MNLPNTPHRRASSGFTLVELLVAISVMAMLSVMAWQALSGMARTDTLTRQRSDDMLAIHAGLGQWGADLDAMIETGEVAAIDFDGRILRLTRRDPLESFQNSPGIEVVAWGMKDGRWSRWQQAGLRTRSDLNLAWQAAARWGERASAADEARQTSIAPAQGWQVFYFRNDAWTHPLSSTGGSESGRPPDGSGRVALPPPPDGVRLVLTLAPGLAISGELTRDWSRPTLGGGKS